MRSRSRWLLAGAMATTSWALGACGANDPAAEDSASATEALGRGRSPDVTVTRSASTACDACFDVESTSAVGFIAVDATPCSTSTPALELYAIGADGSRTRVAASPVPAGNAKPGDGIPRDARTFDGLDGNHYLLCVADQGFDVPGHVHVYTKSPRTWAFGGKMCTPSPLAGTPLWTDDFGLADLSAATDVATDWDGDALVARHAADWEAIAHRGVKKLGPAGNVVWQKPYGETVATDLDGNVYVATAFTGALDIGLSHTVESTAGTDVLVAKLDSAGNPVWQLPLATAADDGATSIAVGPSHEVVVSGPGIGTIRISPSGAPQWAKPYFGRVAIDATAGVLVTGQFTGAIDLGNGTNETQGADYDGFVVKLSSAGVPAWSFVVTDATLPLTAPEGYQVTTPSNQTGRAVAIDPSGDVFVAGETGKTISLLGDQYVFHDVFEGRSGHGIWLAKLDPSGNVLWKDFRDYEYVDGLAADRFGGLALSGGYEGHVSPYQYAVLEQLDASGSRVWRRQGDDAGGWPAGTIAGTGHGVALDRCGNAVWSSTDRVSDPGDVRWFLSKVSP